MIHLIILAIATILCVESGRFGWCAFVFHLFAPSATASKALLQSHCGIVGGGLHGICVFNMVYLSRKPSAVKYTGRLEY